MIEIKFGALVKYTYLYVGIFRVSSNFPLRFLILYWILRNRFRNENDIFYSPIILETFPWQFLFPLVLIFSVSHTLLPHPSNTPSSPHMTFSKFLVSNLRSSHGRLILSFHLWCSLDPLPDLWGFFDEIYCLYSANEVLIIFLTIIN